MGRREGRGPGLEVEVWIQDVAVHTRPRQEAAGLGDFGILETDEEKAALTGLLCIKSCRSCLRGDS